MTSFLSSNSLPPKTTASAQALHKTAVSKKLSAQSQTALDKEPPSLPSKVEGAMELQGAPRKASEYERFVSLDELKLPGEPKEPPTTPRKLTSDEIVFSPHTLDQVKDLEKKAANLSKVAQSYSELKGVKGKPPKEISVKNFIDPEEEDELLYDLSEEDLQTFFNEVNDSLKDMDPDYLQQGLQNLQKRAPEIDKELKQIHDQLANPPKSSLPPLKTKTISTTHPEIHVLDLDDYSSEHEEPTVKVPCVPIRTITEMGPNFDSSSSSEELGQIPEATNSLSNAAEAATNGPSELTGAKREQVLQRRKTVGRLPEGKGGCVKILHALAAGLPVVLTTASSFTVKAWVEYAVAHVCAAYGIHDPAVQTYISGVAGGLAAGLMHMAASKFWGNLLNYCFSIETFSRSPKMSQMALEYLSVSIPVTIGFSAMWGAHDFINPGFFLPTDIQAPLRKTYANITGGFVTGVLIYAVRKAMVSCGLYKENTPKDKDPREFRRTIVIDPLKTQFTEAAKDELPKDSKGRPKEQCCRTFGNNWLGRVVGGPVGDEFKNVIMQPPGDGAKAIGAGASGMAMLLFCVGWFACIHLFEAIGRQCDHANRRRGARSDLEAGGDVSDANQTANITPIHDSKYVPSPYDPEVVNDADDEPVRILSKSEEDGDPQRT